MSRSEALEVLGLEGRPGRDEIIAAHRRLMQRVHPDRGGSKFLAQQLNEAKPGPAARRVVTPAPGREVHPSKCG